MVGSASEKWTDEELALHRDLRALADHGTAVAVLLPLRAPRTAFAPRRPGGRSGMRIATVVLLASTAMAVPIAISGFVPGLPLSGEPVTAVGPPAVSGPLCDTLSDVPAPAEGRVLRPSATGPLALTPAQQEPRLPVEEIKRRLQASGVDFQPGTQLRWGTVGGRAAWAVTTCGPSADGSSAATLTVADEQGRVVGRASSPIEAAAAGRYEVVPRPSGAGTQATLTAGSLTADAQVIVGDSATPRDLRTIMYRAHAEQLCVITVTGSPAQATPSGVCASTLPQDDGEFAVGSSWTNADTAVQVTGFAPVGTAWVSIQQGGQVFRHILLRTADDAHGGRAGFRVELDKNAKTVLLGYSPSGQETGRLIQEFVSR